MRVLAAVVIACLWLAACGGEDPAPPAAAEPSADVEADRSGPTSPEPSPSADPTIVERVEPPRLGPWADDAIVGVIEAPKVPPGSRRLLLIACSSCERPTGSIVAYPPAPFACGMPCVFWGDEARLFRDVPRGTVVQSPDGSTAALATCDQAWCAANFDFTGQSTTAYVSVDHGRHWTAASITGDWYPVAAHDDGGIVLQRDHLIDDGHEALERVAYPGLTRQPLPDDRRAAARVNGGSANALGTDTEGRVWSLGIVPAAGGRERAVVIRDGTPLIDLNPYPVAAAALDPAGERVAVAVYCPVRKLTTRESCAPELVDAAYLLVFSMAGAPQTAYAFPTKELMAMVYDTYVPADRDHRWPIALEELEWTDRSLRGALRVASSHIPVEIDLPAARVRMSLAADSSNVQAEAVAVGPQPEAVVAPLSVSTDCFHLHRNPHDASDLVEGCLIATEPVTLEGTTATDREGNLWRFAFQGQLSGWIQDAVVEAPQ